MTKNDWHDKQERTMKNTCLRCGIDRKDKPYGVCVLYGTAEKRHIWGEFKGETIIIELNDLLTSKDR